MPKSVRRIVTGKRPDGTSYIAEDGPAPAVRTVEGRPGYQVANIWVTHGSPAPIDAPDLSREHEGVLPPVRGTVVRIIEIPPEPTDPEERRRQMDAMFGKLFPDAEHKPAREQHPGMHTTRTIDYAIVLSGELYAIMDEGETLMRAGDILVQRGTHHAWANRSGKPCQIAFILIDGQ